MILSILWLVLTPFFTGIPTGFILVKLVKRQDIRSSGSGNIGATNVRRVLGTGWSLVVLVIDALKGALPVLLGRQFHVGAMVMNGWELPVIGILSILGNVFSPYLGFKGGKGIATSLGVVASLAPVPALVLVGCFVVTAAASNFISLASIVSTYFFPVAICVLDALEKRATEIPLVVFGFALALVVTWTHRENIKRLVKGEEHTIVKSKKNR